eukprot:10619588-Alexandrium_andersonii.AAC.1
MGLSRKGFTLQPEASFGLPRSSLPGSQGWGSPPGLRASHASPFGQWRGGTLLARGFSPSRLS